jgi:hypothetical protein
MEEETRPVAFLELHRLGGGEVDMAPHRPDPAALRHDHGDRLALDHRFERDVAGRARFLDGGAAAAKLGLRAHSGREGRQGLLEFRALAERESRPSF